MQLSLEIPLGESVTREVLALARVSRRELPRAGQVHVWHQSATVAGCEVSRWGSVHRGHGAIQRASHD